MTVLQSLESYYDRLDGIAQPGWSVEKFGWCIVLDRDGSVVDVEDLHDLSGQKPHVRRYMVPAAVGRRAEIASNRLWDKTAYSLGRTLGAGKRTALEHADFVTTHLEWFADESDDGIAALRRFLENWRPEDFDSHSAFRKEMLDANFMFRLNGDQQFVHERPAARALIDALLRTDEEGEEIFCLVSGQRGSMARLHPVIKGVEKSQLGGASLVSFNLDAFTSFDKAQGANAPVSAASVFRYGAVLNRLLTRDGPNRLRRPVGDATVIFWADACSADAAIAADSVYSQFMGESEDANASKDKVTDEEEARKIGEQMKAVAEGKPIAALRADIEPGTRFHILGLSPNAARLSVRFWMTDTFDQCIRRLADHHLDLMLEPRPLGWGVAPSVNRLLVRTTALQEKFENIPPLLAGEVMRAILSGTRYPTSLLAATIIRLRAGDDPLSGWHAAVIRAVLHREHRFDPKKEDAPVSLAIDEANIAYQLGRLFAVLETAQYMALGRVNATIRDRYFGSASATPANVFPLLLRGVQNHLAKLRKTGKGIWLERDIASILDKLALDFPRSLPLIEQGRFVIGYYQQRQEHFKGQPDAVSEPDVAERMNVEGNNA